MNQRLVRTPPLRACWASSALMVGLLVGLLGCGDDLPTENTEDAAIGVADGIEDGNVFPDGIGPGGEACPDGIGCPCVANDDCTSGLCWDASKGVEATKDNAGACAKPCETNGKPGCDDGSPCTVDSCTPSVHKDTDAQCGHAPLKNGTGCDDGNACSSADRCVAGACTGDLVVCNDNNPCTSDSCKGGSGAGCVYANNDGAPCDDGSVCTTNDACGGGACVSGKPTACDDQNPCTEDACDGKLGCTYKATTAGCTDGNACTAGDACKGGVCVPGQGVLCDDGNPCTTDACLPAAGCTVTNDDGATCSDGDVCTKGDTCAGGTCAPAKQQSCDDGNPCTIDSCDKVKGCQQTKLDGDACDDGTVCTVGDTCKAGACTPGGALACNDGNPCTTDACDPLIGCKTKPADGKVCVPAGNSCDVGGVCAAGVCKTVKQSGCNDGNPCTTDTCDAKTGACSYEPVTDGDACNDGDACIVSETCQKGACLGAPADCDDNNGCTTDACDAETGCSHAVGLAKDATKGCDDGNLCTVGDACKSGVCQPGQPQNCGDGNPCTDAACDPASGCKPGAKGSSCDDGNACTTGDSCVAGNCVPGKPQSCDDGNACTLDSCDPKSGCKAKIAGLSCSDGNVCTVGDGCQGGLCVAGKLQVCSDGNTCTNDTCDAIKGCVALNNTASCDDGDVCTSNDICQGGVCNSGVALSCDDKNGCTDDFCEKKTGCVHSPTNSACDDGNKCTVGDGCKTGKCFPGTKQVCDDKNHCTTDSCHPTKGCVQTANTLGCDDGNICTVADTCGGGACNPGSKQLACNDGIFCTDDFCDPKTGCNSVKTDRLCNDGDACTIKDACKLGVCVAGAAKNCDDLNKCTDDFCDATKGCIHVANGPNAFKPFYDAAQYNKDYWAFGGTTTIKAFGHAGAGFYRMITGDAGSTQTMTLQEKVDLKCTGAPYLYWTERYAGGQLFVEASKDGLIWVPMAKHINITDHVWRENEVDLSQYKGIPVWVRFRAVPSNTSQWWDIREIRLSEKAKDLPVKPWGYVNSCATWETEGPAWKCDKTTSPYQLRYNGVTQVPDPNNYANIIRQNVVLDAADVKNPALSFEERAGGGTLYVDIRKPDGVWENIYTRASLTDYVWRTRVLYVGKYAGAQAQVRLRSTQSNAQFGHVRNVTGIDKAPPGTPTTQGVPSKLQSCGDWTYDGSAWLCNPSAKVWDLGWVGDSSSEYNTNGYLHYALWGKRLDLTKAKDPVLRFDRRYYNGYTYLQISETKANWTNVWTNINGSDYVWRPQIVDLSKYVGKTWYVRFVVQPNNGGYWWQLRNLRLDTKPAALSVSKYPFTLACADWTFEGPSWKCDNAKKPWFLRMDAVDTLPNPGGYSQPALLARWVDLTAAKAPGFAFEYRRHYSVVNFEVSEDGSAWQTLHTFGSAIDYVWRKAHIDLAKFKGKKILIRINGVPSSSTYWGELRNVRFLDVEPVVTVPYLKATSACTGFELEGIGWRCADAGQDWKLRFDGVSTEPNPNGYYQHARSTWLLDLAGAKAPTLYFDYRHYYGTLRINIEGPNDVPKTIYTEAGSFDTVWHDRTVDLSAYAGHKIYVTFTAVPGGDPYWGEIRNIAYKERLPVVTSPIGSTLGKDDFVPHGGWSWHAKIARWRLLGTQITTYHWLKSNKAYDLTQAKNPVIIYREATWGPARYLKVSVDGVNWEDAGLGSNINDPVAHRREISLDKWIGKKVYVAFAGYPYLTTNWWEVFDIRIVEKPAQVKVKAGTQLTASQWDAEGNWSWTSGAFWSLNHGVNGGSNSDALQPYWQTLSTKVAFDVSKLKNPTLLFKERNQSSTLYIDVSSDRVQWTEVWVHNSSNTWNTYWQHLDVDLTAHQAQGALYVRFRALANNAAYWQELEGATIVERPVLPTATKGYSVKPTEWLASGLWQWDSNNSWWQVSDTVTSRYHRYTLQRTYSVGSNKSAKLVLEDAYAYGYRFVQVSDNGSSWVTVLQAATNATKDQTFHTTTIDLTEFLASVGANPTVHVRLLWYAPQSGNWWRVRKLSFQ